MMQDFSFVHKYFIAEKQAGMFFLVVGVVSVLLSLLFFVVIKTNPSLYKGMAIPLLVIGLLQSVVGFTVYSRSDTQRMDVSYKIGMDPGFVRNTELPRMEKVMRNFTIYKYVEIALLIAGIVLVVLYRTNESKQFLYGVGIALAIQAAVSLGADVMAEKRGGEYRSRLLGRVGTLQSDLTPKS